MSMDHVRVYVENPYQPHIDMWEKQNATVVNAVRKANLIHFTGGDDINPALYGHSKHPLTRFDASRDHECQKLWNYAQRASVASVGVGRGAGFLHVMNGGYLVQNCDGHICHGGHLANVAFMPNTQINVQSCHHQMMGAPEIGEVLMWTNRAKFKHLGEVGLKAPPGFDIEAMVYYDTNSLSYQPQPEFNTDEEADYDECENAFFFMIRNYLDVKP